MWLPQELYKVAGGVLSDARKRAGLTQVQLAKKLRKAQSFVSSYESGQRRLDIMEMARVAEAISANPVSLYAKILRDTRGGGPSQRTRA